EGRTSRSVRGRIEGLVGAGRVRPATRDGPVGPSETRRRGDPPATGATRYEGRTSRSVRVEVAGGHRRQVPPATRDGPVGPSEVRPCRPRSRQGRRPSDGPVGPSEGPLRDPIRVKAFATTLRAVRSTAGT